MEDNKESKIENEELDVVEPETSAEEGSTADNPEDLGGESGDTEEEKKEFPWYVLEVFSSQEDKAITYILEKIRQQGMEDSFGDIIAPEETVSEIVKGERKTKTRKINAGYVFIQMEMNQNTWHLVKDTPKVKDFLGGAANPEMVSAEEMKKVFERAESGSIESVSRVSFDVGDSVRIVDGHFKDFDGTIEEVRPDKGKLKVLISIFGRQTPVELEFGQVERS